MRALAVLGALAALAGCAGPYGQAQTIYREGALARDQLIEDAWYLGCERRTVRKVVDKFSHSEELWRAFWVACGYTGRVTTPPRPQGESSEPELDVEVLEGGGRYLEPVPDDGGPIDFGLIE